MIHGIRTTRWYWTALVFVAVLTRLGAAEELRSASPNFGDGRPISPNFLSNIAAQLTRLSGTLHESRIDLPRQPRVTHTHSPLRQITLIGGDRFVGECLDWGTQTAEFRLQSGQIVSLPVFAISRLANPPGEFDMLVDSFEADSTTGQIPQQGRILDDTTSAGGKSSLRIDSHSPGYRQALDPPLAAARIEFSFQITNADPSSPSGEWHIEWTDSDPRILPLVVQVGPDSLIKLSGIPLDSDSMSQTLKLTDGWHTFIALVAHNRTRLIVDENILASFDTPKASLKAIRFPPVDSNSINMLWIDELQIRKLENPEDVEGPSEEPIDRDILVTATGDELFGRIMGVTPTFATLESLGKLRSIPLSRLSSLNWSQTSNPVRQLVAPRGGAVARIEMQSFVDRPACAPDAWTVTITKVDSKHLFVQHSLIGEMKLRWADVTRVEPQFFGQTFLIDARRLHLGNSIRSDFHRQLPDGTHIRGEFALANVPLGQTFISLDVAEIEAAGPDAPPGSPFLAQLRAGHLVTEVLINDQIVGNLNQYIRLKATVKKPDRIRLAIPKDLLKREQNTYQLRQQPLKPNGREFDDGEVGNIRIDVEQ